MNGDDEGEGCQKSWAMFWFCQLREWHDHSLRCGAQEGEHNHGAGAFSSAHTEFDMPTAYPKVRSCSQSWSLERNWGILMVTEFIGL